jgi:hypothetical protein
LSSTLSFVSAMLSRVYRRSSDGRQLRTLNVQGALIILLGYV